MFRVSDLIDLPIKILKDSKKLNYAVKSVLIDASSNRVEAIICKESTIKKSFRIVPYDRILAIDIDGVIIPDEKCIKKVFAKDMGKYIQLNDIVNKTIVNVHGNLQGTLSDLYINLLSGKIESLEISEGYLDDIVRGRRIVSLEHAIKNHISFEGITTFLRIN